MPRLREPLGGEYAYDEGTFLYYSWRISAGHVLYRDFFDFKGIVSYLPTAFVYFFTGPSFVVGRLTQFAIVAGISGLSCSNAIQVTGRRWAGVLAGAFTPLVSWPTWPNAYHDLTAQLFLLLALRLAFRALAVSALLRARAWCWAGVCAGLAFWTSLAQGTAGTFALLVAASLTGFLLEGRKNAQHVATWFSAGFAAVAGVLALYGLATRSLGAMLRAVFVFPFTKYGATNVTAYAEDMQIWIDRWSSAKPELALGAKVICHAVALTLPLATLAALLVAVVAIVRLLHESHAASADFCRLVLTAALAATAVPVLVSKTRSDLCHIGFVAPGCALVIVATLAYPAYRARGFRAAQGVVALGVASVLTVAGWFGARNAFANFERRPFRQIDALTRGAFSVDSDDELLAPTDLTVHLPPGYYPGGYAYLLSRRHSAIAFSILEDDGEYYADQWPEAANEIVARRPRLMKITRADLTKLASYRPEIAKMYFGFDGRYMLDDKRPSRIDGDSAWTYTLSNREAGTITLKANGGQLRAVFRNNAGATGELAGSIDGDRVAILHSQRVYVARLSADGTAMTGHVYVIGTPNNPPLSFAMQRAKL